MAAPAGEAIVALGFRAGIFIEGSAGLFETSGRFQLYACEF